MKDLLTLARAITAGRPITSTSLQLQAIDEANAAIETADKYDTLPDEAPAIERNDATIGRLMTERASLKAEVARLSEQLIESRQTIVRMQAERFATPAPQVVATDAFALHFHGPQGVGTADRIKAIGGRWQFHAKAVRDQFNAAGYWLLPETAAARDLCRTLDAEGKRIETRAL